METFRNAIHDIKIERLGLSGVAATLAGSIVLCGLVLIAILL